MSLERAIAYALQFQLLETCKYPEASCNRTV